MQQQQQKVKGNEFKENLFTQLGAFRMEIFEVTFISYIYLSPFHTMWNWEQDLAPVFQFPDWELKVGCQRVIEPVLSPHSQ